MRTIQEGWETYRKVVLPENASLIQVSECKRAFYAGAAQILSITFQLGGSDISESAAVEVIEGLHQEVISFNRAR